ncbi:MAG: SAM-dependent methyltransferase [Clostridia bacterium]|nr:SAM-dependent methyltransferase [Clostridia bacterium]
MTDLFNHRRAPILDGRLSAAMELADNTKVFADIGADHGRLSTVLLLADPARRALVADISAAALSKAQRRIQWMGLADRAVFSVADGLDALDSMTDCVPDTIFILGMGGDTVSGILRRGQSRLRGSALILGAQTELPLVRSALVETGYRISREIIASENERDYILIRAEKALADEPEYSEEELLLGPVLLQECPESWEPVLKRRERLLTQGITAMNSAMRTRDAERLALFKRELEYVQRALERIHSGKEE